MLIISLMSVKILIKMAHIQYHEKYHVTTILADHHSLLMYYCTYWAIVLMGYSGPNYVLNVH